MIQRNQTLGEIILETKTDISTATQYKILWEAPSGTLGAWTGALEGTTKIKVTLSDTDYPSEEGVYKLQAFVLVGTLKGYGDVIETNIGETLE
jgi:hypothetical protein